MNIDLNLKYFRNISGMTQKRFADKLGITQGALSKIESGSSGTLEKYSAKIIPVIEEFKKERIEKLEKEIEFIRNL